MHTLLFFLDLLLHAAFPCCLRRVLTSNSDGLAILQPR